MTICFFDVTRNWSAEAPASGHALTRVGRLLRVHCNRRDAAGLTEFFSCQRVCQRVCQQEPETHDNMAALSARSSPAKAGKRRRESSEENTSEAKAPRKRLRESETTLERAERYRILTAKMPVEALTADWIEGRNRVIQPGHVKALCKIFQRGDMKRASHPLAVLCTRPAVKCMLHRLGYRDDDDVAGMDDVPAFDDWMREIRHRVELVDGQHRIEALKEYVSKTGAGKEELYWHCNLYDRGMSARRDGGSPTA